MTGYGKAITEVSGSMISVEIKSLNSKFLDLNFKLPKTFLDREFQLRTEIANTIERGKCSVVISIEQNKTIQQAVSVNTELAKSYLKTLKAFAEIEGLNTDNLLEIILKLPDVLNVDASESEEEWSAVLVLVKKALVEYDAFREEEGKKTSQDLVQSVNTILSNLDKVIEIDPERVKYFRQKLKNNIELNIPAEKFDESRFEQEILYYLEKMDITEEKSRLKYHCEFFIETLNTPNSNGKKLGFLTQEMGREINTMGSKANYLDIQVLTVDMKNELEKIKEQVLNIL